jgi:alkylhydroperoxidase family enzyme
MTRIAGVNPDEVERQIKVVLDAQAKAWGGPLLNHLVYARRPTIFRGARAMWAGIEASQLIAPALRALINRRVAFLNGCEF